MTEIEVLERLTIPGLNIEATFEPRELAILVDAIREIVRHERLRERELWERRLARVRSQHGDKWI